MPEQPTSEMPTEDPGKVPAEARGDATVETGKEPAAGPGEAPSAESKPDSPAEPRTAPLDPIEHDRRVRRFLLRLSLANWGVAALAWTVSAFLGMESPASIIVYSVLFVIGLIAAIIAILTYLLEKFGHEPSAAEPGEHDPDEGDAEAAPAGDAPSAAAG